MRSLKLSGHRPSRFAAGGGLAAILAALLLAAGCGPDDPIEKISDARSRYTAELNSFVIDSTPAEGDLFAVAEESAGEEEGAIPAGEGGEEPIAAEVAVEQAVILDFLVKSELYEQLPGITLEVSHVDRNKVEKAHHRIWVDTSAVVKGRGQSFTHRLEGVDYEEGDGFLVEVRHPVPAAERGDYRELSAPAGGG